MEQTQPKITAEQRREWVLAWLVALEGGKYRQGPDVLHNHDNETWCCLGVACDLLSAPLAMKRELSGDREAFGGISMVLPNDAKLALGLNEDVGSFANQSLAALNDEGKSFSGIADIIRSMPPGLFTEEAEAQLRPVLQPQTP